MRALAVREGLAFIDPAVMPGACDAELWTIERAAERRGRGLWARLPAFEATDGTLGERRGTVAFVTGTVLSVGQTRRTIYLNFGDDRRTDFTVMVAREQEEALRPASLEGATVRVRGVLDEWNGGLIRVEHIGQIERLP